MKEVAISTPYITLGQVLKLADCVGSGGEVKSFLQANNVKVNGMAETRRGRKLVPGDSVAVEGMDVIVIKAR